MTTCSFCGKEFDETQSNQTCQSCALFGGCKNWRCPHCGGEMPQTPRLIRRLFGRTAPKGKSPHADKAQ